MSIPRLAFAAVIFLILLILAGLATAASGSTWVSIGPDGRELEVPVPPEGELYRICRCSASRGGERVCYCTQPAPTVDESFLTPATIDRQQREDLPASDRVPAQRPRMNYAVTVP